MIELNCSYEESKKILELGYDFRKICTKFEVKTDIEYQVCYGAVITSDKWNRVEIESSRVIQDEGKLEHGQRIAFNPLSIPIIPKAALEACLPEYKGYDHDNVITYRWAGHTSMRSVCFCQFTDDWYIELEDFIHQHKSACEAFIWCHEHYPEELKKKFSEVMG